MRVVFTAAGATIVGAASAFADDRERFEMTWRCATDEQQAGHAAGLPVRPLPGRSALSLADRRIADDIVAMVANYPRETYAASGFRRHPVPLFARHARDQDGAGGADLATGRRSTGTELVVLARYMQILSDGLCREAAGRCINIHHSFLPGFKGARPYHQAHERGVKLIGATAHYVTPDLDEGPIIEQDVERIAPRHAGRPGPQGPRHRAPRAGARGPAHHLEDRVLLNGGKTVVVSWTSDFVQLARRLHGRGWRYSPLPIRHSRP